MVAALSDRSSFIPQQLSDKTENPRLALLNVILGMVAIFGCYVAPMYLVGHWNLRAGVWLAAALASIVLLKSTWYDNLSAEQGDTSVEMR